MLPLLMAAAITTAPQADEKAVHDAEDRWSAAFVIGDAAYLQGLLADDYVSVGQNGEAHPKAAILAAATKYAASHPGAQPQPMPASSQVEVHGDLALVRHNGGDDVSVDVFQKRGGRWVAWYSQHTARKAG